MKLGFGTAAIGRPHYINIRSEPVEGEFDITTFREKGVSILEAAYQGGIRYFDTAPGYGIAEDILRQWLEAHPHDDVELATKWGYRYTANFDPNADVHEVKEHSIGTLDQQWATSRSLPRLSSLQIHSATFDSGVLGNEDVLNRLADIRAAEGLRIGLSVSGADQVEVLRAAMDIERDGRPLFDLIQASYNVFDQSLATLQDELRGRRLVIKEALANGRVFPNEEYPDYTPAYCELLELSDKYDVGVDAIALRFCLDALSPFRVLSGAATVEQVQSNLQAETFKLSSDEVQSLQSLAVEPETYWVERKQLPWN